MEKLAYMILGFGVLGLVLLAGGGWLLHTAINLGDFFRGVVGVIGLAIGFKLVIPSIMMLGSSR